MKVWSFIQEKLEASVDVILLWVLESEGSSPGRQGFKMAVAGDGSFSGTIGGGMMEHKLVEKARDFLTHEKREIFLQRQHHDKLHSKDQSGMICSGSQLIAFVPITSADQNIITNILAKQDDREKVVYLSPQGLAISTVKENKTGLAYEDDEHWSYCELIDQRPIIHIIGGGHVGLALSELMNFLGFYIKIYDNRNNLNTINENRFAHQKTITDYDQIGSTINDDKDAFVVIMTFGYRDDKTVFKQLLNKKFFYKGLMGSETKINTLVKELVDEGYKADQWKDWFMPVGINIHSKTTKEIAVSIAAEIIREKNKHLASKRTQQLDS